MESPGSRGFLHIRGECVIFNAYRVDSAFFQRPLSLNPLPLRGNDESVSPVPGAREVTLPQSLFTCPRNGGRWREAPEGGMERV